MTPSAPASRSRRFVAPALAFTAASALLLAASVSTPVVVGASDGRTGAQEASWSDTRWGGGAWGDEAWGDDETDDNARDSSDTNEPSLDAGSLATVTTVTGARDVWRQRDAAGKAITGQGVTVALLDTGIAPEVMGLDSAGKVLEGPDLSLEANSAALRGGDTYGHGTHLAGIIAARDAVTTDARTGRPLPADTSVQLGMAPDARLLAVKLATTDGSTDVSQVIAGLDWVVQHRNDNGMRIRVVNLSYGTDSAQSYRLDPLAAAAENAWRHGIVVVVSGGNDGPAAAGLTNPAIDPFVIAVGASDAQAQTKGWGTPTPAPFTSRGTSSRHVDLVAPGTSIAALRAPGSFVDVNNPQGRVDGDTTGRLFRGSGTSQAAAVVSGSVALLLQAYPDLTPDQVKAILVQSADPMYGSSALDVGAGQLDVKAALALARLAGVTPGLSASLSRQFFTAATGLGELEAARGDSHLFDPGTGEVLSGEVDVQGQAWNPQAWRAVSVAGTSWENGNWNGSRWTGDGWDGSHWTNAVWDGTRWTGAKWSDVSWDGAKWSGAKWSGAKWSGAKWTDVGWL